MDKPRFLCILGIGLISVLLYHYVGPVVLFITVCNMVISILFFYVVMITVVKNKNWIKKLNDNIYQGDTNG